MPLNKETKRNSVIQNPKLEPLHSTFYLILKMKLFYEKNERDKTTLENMIHSKYKVFS